MIRFSANLGFLWTELPLLDRIEAAARAGFKAVELHYPYATPPETVRDLCGRLGLTLLGVNTDIGSGAAQHSGLGALPGREREFQSLIDQSVAWVAAAGGTSIHAMAGIVPEDQRAAGAETLIANLKSAAPKAPPICGLRSLQSKQAYANRRRNPRNPATSMPSRLMPSIPASLNS